jgi:hypothetical protein
LLKQQISKYGGVDEPTLYISPQGLQHPRNTYFVLTLPQIALPALSLSTHFWKISQSSHFLLDLVWPQGNYTRETWKFNSISNMAFLPILARSS